MSITNSVRALLQMKGLKQGNLVSVFGLANAQSLSNKFREERWSAQDLVKIAEYTDCKLAFILPNGERLLIESSATVPPSDQAPVSTRNASDTTSAAGSAVPGDTTDGGAGRSRGGRN